VNTLFLQYFDTVGWVFCPVKNRLPYNLYCVGRDVKHCTIQSVNTASRAKRNGAGRRWGTVHLGLQAIDRSPEWWLHHQWMESTLHVRVKAQGVCVSLEIRPHKPKVWQWSTLKLNYMIITVFISQQQHHVLVHLEWWRQQLLSLFQHCLSLCRCTGHAQRLWRHWTPARRIPARVSSL